MQHSYLPGKYGDLLVVYGNIFAPICSCWPGKKSFWEACRGPLLVAASTRKLREAARDILAGYGVPPTSKPSASPPNKHESRELLIVLSYFARIILLDDSNLAQSSWYLFSCFPGVRDLSLHRNNFQMKGD